MKERRRRHMMVAGQEGGAEEADEGSRAGRTRERVGR